MRGISSSDEFALHMFMHCVMSQCLNFDKLIRPFPPYTHIYIYMYVIHSSFTKQNAEWSVVYHLSTFRLWPIAVCLHSSSFILCQLFFIFIFVFRTTWPIVIFIFFKEVLCKLWMGRVGEIKKGLFDCKFSFKLHDSFCCDWMGIVCIFEKIIQAKL